jgi:hypothetical protein
MEKKRSDSARMPLIRTIVDKNRVKKVKLATKPTTTPNGFCLPLPSADDKMIGINGRMQGERTVTTPARKANRMSNSI